MLPFHNKTAAQITGIMINRDRDVEAARSQLTLQPVAESILTSI